MPGLCYTGTRKQDPMKTASIAIVASAFLAFGLALPASADTVTLTPSADTYVMNNSPSTNFGSQDAAYISFDPGPLYARTLLKFDLSSIPAGSTIESATLIMTLKSYSIDATTQTAIYRSIGDWEENAVTWNDMPALGDQIQSQLVAGYSPEYWDLTDAVKNWLSGAWANQGVVIKTNESYGPYLTFGYWTRESGLASNAPQLAVTYTPPAVAAVKISDLSVAPGTTAVTVSFMTNVSATGTVEYGTTADYGLSVTEDGTPGLNHAITLLNLSPNTTYHFRAKAAAADSSDMTADTVFTTGLVSPAPRPANAGELVKTAGSTAVYYIGSDGKRHAFPNALIYASWYPDFSGVKTISDSDMATYQLGGNVAYKPGSRLVKFQSLPKTYAVDRNGTLRWVKDEATAVALYGADWNSKVDDLSDALYTDYTFGADIASSADYSPASAAASAPTISDNL